MIQRVWPPLLIKIQFLVKGDETFDLDINQIKDEKFCKEYEPISRENPIHFWAIGC